MVRIGGNIELFDCSQQGVIETPPPRNDVYLVLNRNLRRQNVVRQIAGGRFRPLRVKENGECTAEQKRDRR